MNLNTAFETFSAAQFAGQQLNADLQAKRDDHELRQQQLASAKQQMAMQANAQAQQQQFEQQRAGIIDKYDTMAKEQRVADGTDPDAEVEQQTAREAAMYRDIGKAALLTNPAMAEQYFKLADTSSGKAVERKKANLEITEKKTKDTAAFAGSVLAGGVSPDQAFAWVKDNLGLKAALAIPTDPVQAKAYWRSAQRQGMSATEQVENERKVEEFKQKQEQAAKEEADRREERQIRRAELAASREANLELRKQSLGLRREQFEEGGTVQHQRNIAAVEYGAEIARNLANVTKFASSTNGALFAGVPAGTSLLGALQGNAANKLTPEGEQMLKVAMGGMGLEMGQLMTSSGGRGVTQTLINELHEMMAYRASDTPMTKMFKMANAAELARVRLESTPEPRNPATKEKREQALAALKEYPTPAQIIEVAQRKGQKIAGAKELVSMKDKMKQAIAVGAEGTPTAPPPDVADLLNKYK